MFWIWILIAILIVIGATVLGAKLLSDRAAARLDPDRRQQLTALKVSGALRHRKSNQP